MCTHDEDILTHIWNDLLSIEDKPTFSKNNNVCNNCGSNEIFLDTSVGDLLCNTCGFIKESHYILDEAEWNNYTDDNSPSVNNARCGPGADYTNPYDSGNTYVPKNLFGIYFDADGNKRYSNISRLAMRMSYTSKQRAFNEGKYTFENIQCILNLTDTVFNTAKLYWGIILKTDILKRGANRRGMKACCIFYACLSEKQQRGREEIARAFDITGTNDFTKGEKIFREIFEKNTDHSWILFRNSENELMYSRYIKELGLPYRINILMGTIKEHCKEHFLGIAAKSEISGLLCYSCKDLLNFKHPNKTEIAKTIGICNPTLNKVIEIIKYYYKNNPDKKELLQPIIKKINEN
jgi:transcription initiation factor TFIIIB Brf1 subunit/transcription initiation factor TFIIB